MDHQIGSPSLSDDECQCVGCNHCADCRITNSHLSAFAFRFGGLKFTGNAAADFSEGGIWRGLAPEGVTGAPRVTGSIRRAAPPPIGSEATSCARGFSPRSDDGAPVPTVLRRGL